MANNNYENINKVSIGRAIFIVFRKIPKWLVFIVCSIILFILGYTICNLIDSEQTYKEYQMTGREIAKYEINRKIQKKDSIYESGIEETFLEIKQSFIGGKYKKGWCAIKIKIEDISPSLRSLFDSVEVKIENIAIFDRTKKYSLDVDGTIWYREVN